METARISRRGIVTPSSYATLLVPVAGLIVALLLKNIIALNYVHVITGGSWTGIDLFMGVVMTRVMRGLSPEARVDVVKRLVPLMLFLMPALSAVAITSGIYLAEWEGLLNFQSPMIIVAGIIVIILSIQGFGVIMPTEVRVYLELGKPVPNKDKVVRLSMRNIKVAGN